MDKQPTREEYLVHKAEQYVRQFESNENNKQDLENIKRQLVYLVGEIGEYGFLGVDLITDYLWEVILEIDEMKSVAE